MYNINVRRLVEMYVHLYYKHNIYCRARNDKRAGKVIVYAPFEVMVGRVRSTPAYAVDNFGVKGGCFIFPSNQNTHVNLNFVLIKKI